MTPTKSVPIMLTLFLNASIAADAQSPGIPPPRRTPPTNIITISDSPSGGGCVAWGQEAAAACAVAGGPCGTQYAVWNGSTKECKTTSINLPAGKTLNINAGVTLRIIAVFVVMGDINNYGTLLIGGYPAKHSSGFTVGGTLLNRGTISNHTGATLKCLTNSYLENHRDIKNSGQVHFGCNVKLKSGKLENDGLMFIQDGTPTSSGVNARTVNDGIVFNDIHIVNRGGILQGKGTTVINYGTGKIENYSTYNVTGGSSFRNHGTFDNICNGKALNLKMTQGNAAVTKPCDTDGDGIPDTIDQCPNQKENFNGFMDTDGCPDATGGSTQP